jgi:S1-C subfamily serine protease
VHNAICDFASHGDTAVVTVCQEFSRIQRMDARRRVILEPTTRTPRPMEYDASGLLLTSSFPGFQGITVLAVDPGSPGDAAGIQAGDSLMAIDGMSPTRLGLSGVRERFSQVNTPVQLVILHRGKERHVVLRLRPRL